MKNQAEIIKELQKAYWSELETVMNYLATSVNLDGIMAERVKDSLADDVTEETQHATMLANRIKELGGTVEGSYQFKAKQSSLQPTADSTDIEAAVNGVIEAEENAIAQYQKIIKLCDGEDFVTEDLCIELLADEQKHLTLFRGFAKELAKIRQQYNR